MAEQEIPPLTERGLLPEGVHRMTIEQVEVLFGQFQRSERRCRLFAKLKEFYNDCKLSGRIAAIIVDGSFVMGCVDEPEDIDLAIILPSDWDFRAQLPPFAYNLFAKWMAKKMFGFDVFRVREGSVQEAKWMEFFPTINMKWNEPPLSLPVGIRKGLARIDL
jgi:hypothetical protein